MIYKVECFFGNLRLAMNFSEMIRKYTLGVNNKVNSCIRPIKKHFGVNHFWYYTLSNEGRYSCLGSNADWMEYYFDQKLYLPNPYLRKPQNFQTGISFIRKLNDAKYQESVDLGVKSFKIEQSLIFLERTDVGVTGFGFASHLPNELFETLCVNEMPLLKLFTRSFADKFSSIISSMENDNVDLASIIGPEFYNKKNEFKRPIIDKTDFLSFLQLSKISDLTPREKTLLSLLSKGLYAHQIADRLELSKRTIEHYTDNIKMKLDCYTKAELIQKAQDYFSLEF